MIRLQNVTKHYSPEVAALSSVSFSIDKGRFVFLVGPSGSGKSTLLRMMNRQDRKSTRLNSSHIPLSRMPSSA